MQDSVTFLTLGKENLYSRRRTREPSSDRLLCAPAPVRALVIGRGTRVQSMPASTGAASGCRVFRVKSHDSVRSLSESEAFAAGRVGNGALMIASVMRA